MSTTSVYTYTVHDEFSVAMRVRCCSADDLFAIHALYWHSANKIQFLTLFHILLEAQGDVYKVNSLS
ncbi:hypothetical protein SOMG_03204 [Schizosaccharomyces osmophilus]|uniref:Uncharacterized protein n=1 Tax=Schizosaccharomyces osmophilus TaxID=2545709 RepID=A0AAE9WES9_9SCHI|nr:uncharacterized protein SOMG_03204 [Schizosaccharomyces osmophilus]WBW73433.1 hypothetical protein SOMG_03204 [Schizosaccharomyces osmophilus]